MARGVARNFIGGHYKAPLRYVESSRSIDTDANSNKQLIIIIAVGREMLFYYIFYDN